MKNIILLDEGNYDGCLYVSKETYDQAILLWGRLDGDADRVESMLLTPAMKYNNASAMKDLVDDLKATMPAPLNMLAPFLMYAVESGITIKDGDYKKAYGILHMYSQLIDFNAMTLVPAEVRLAVKLPVSVLNNYESSWDDICSTLEEKVVMTYSAPVPMTSVPVTPMPAPVPQTAPMSAPTTAPTPAPAQPVQDISKGSVTRADGKVVNLADIDAMLAQMDAEEKEREEKKKANPTPAPKPAAPKVEATPAPAATSSDTKASSVLDAFDI